MGSAKPYALVVPHIQPRWAIVDGRVIGKGADSISVKIKNAQSSTHRIPGINDCSLLVPPAEVKRMSS